MFEKDDIIKKLRKHTPEILDVYIFQAHMKDCISNCKSYFDSMPERTKEAFSKKRGKES